MIDLILSERAIEDHFGTTVQEGVQRMIRRGYKPVGHTLNGNLTFRRIVDHDELVALPGKAQINKSAPLDVEEACPI